MTWWEGGLLGLVQGLTEFLPVSSSGHLVMGQALLGADMPGVGFEVSLHLATLASVLVAYRRRIGALLAGVARRDPEHVRYAGLLALASVPAGTAGVGFGGFFARLFEAEAATGAALVVTGFVLWTSKRAGRRSGSRRLGWRAAAGMGLAQAAAIAPGVSRSGTTVVAGLWSGVAPAEAAAFSFLMYVPAVAGAALLELPGMASAPSGQGAGAWPLAVGGAVAFASGVFAIRLFGRLLERGSLHRFAPYLWAVGIAFSAYALFA